MTTVAFIADENIDAPIIARLRADGLDILSVGELDPGIDDDRVLEIANQQSRILITSDRDFGELVFRLGRSAAGILLLRLAGLSGRKEQSSSRPRSLSMAPSFSARSP